MSDWWGQPSGRVNGGEFDQWHYRVQFDEKGNPMAISDGSMLVLIWPGEAELRPLPARMVYMPPGFL